MDPSIPPPFPYKCLLAKESLMYMSYRYLKGRMTRLARVLLGQTLANLFPCID